MDDLLVTMSKDMGINRYAGEKENSFIYRLCYSALGQWCIQTARNFSDGTTGTTKHNQTIIVKELLQRYTDVFPPIADGFHDARRPHLNFPVHVRRVYEETGYFLTDKCNRNQVANYGRNIYLKNATLFFGIPNGRYTVNGLGVFSPTMENPSSLREFLIRDTLSCDEYFRSKYDVVDFYERDFASEELQFFNPLSKRSPSQSWEAEITTDYSVARKTEAGPFYRVIRMSDKTLLFADEIVEQQNDSFTSYEYRRLYFSLKEHYKIPLKAKAIRQDEEYSKLIIDGHLPNREYYLLLLLSWPVNNVFDKSHFLIRNDFIPEVAVALKNIGIDVKGGNTNG